MSKPLTPEQKSPVPDEKHSQVESPPASVPAGEAAKVAHAVVASPSSENDKKDQEVMTPLVMPTVNAADQKTSATGNDQKPAVPSEAAPAGGENSKPTLIGAAAPQPLKMETRPTSEFRSFFVTTSGSSDKVQTDYLNLPQDKGDIGQRTPTPGTARLDSASKLRWKIGDEVVIMALEDRVVVGRAMEGDNTIGFDLTPYGAFHFGVSRMHAILTLQDGFLYLEDLNSTNGTRINGFQVTPKQRYRLRDADEIEFARLRTGVRFELAGR